MKKSKIICFGKLLTVVVALSLVTSCAREISSDTYTADHIGEAQVTYAGVILNARAVKVCGAEKLEGNGAGVGAGLIGGAAAGSAVGKGSGNVIATVGGAILGAVGGAFAEKGLSSQNGMEYVVQLEKGDLMTIVQGANPAFSVGQEVYVITATLNERTGKQNRSRIIARTGTKVTLP